MAFTVEQFHQLTQLLCERPELRTEWRPVLLTDEILNLPQLLTELAAAQKRTDERLDRVESGLHEVKSDLHVVKNDVAE